MTMMMVRAIPMRSCLILNCREKWCFLGYCCVAPRTPLRCVLQHGPCVCVFSFSLTHPKYCCWWCTALISTACNIMHFAVAVFSMVILGVRFSMHVHCVFSMHVDGFLTLIVCRWLPLLFYCIKGLHVRVYVCALLLLFLSMVLEALLWYLKHSCYSCRTAAATCHSYAIPLHCSYHTYHCYTIVQVYFHVQLYVYCFVAIACLHHFCMVNVCLNMCTECVTPSHNYTKGMYNKKHTAYSFWHGLPSFLLCVFACFCAHIFYCVCCVCYCVCACLCIKILYPCCFVIWYSLLLLVPCGVCKCYLSCCFR